MINRFMGYIEIKTKITSVFAFLMTLAYLFYRNQDINWKLTLIFFAGMFLFDLTTTAINNYIDTKTNDQVLQFKRRTALIIIIMLLLVSTALGLYLAYLTDVVILLAGALCFMCGVLYTGGPVPISRQPLGEIMSGVFYGFFIPFILLYINMPHGEYVVLSADSNTFSISFSIWPMAALLLLSVTPTCTTANIMLANNICDVEKDVAVRRFTLPYYLRAKRSLYLFAMIYYATYVAVIAMVVLKILPAICLLYILTIVPVQKNLNVFFKKQEKATTFIVSIKNYIILMGALTALIFAGGLLS